MDRRPLPRSLEPIQGESLSGYLLRLAHRLELAPRDVCEATGLVSRYTHTVPNRILLSMDPVTTRSLCDATRLTPAEASALTYRGLHDAYPPANPTAFPSHGRKCERRVQVNESWLFLGATRYCPQCLAGDASVIQNAHGGGWDKRWRLPLYFACPTHRRFLSHLCPACANPAMANNPLYRAQLIPAPQVAGLHPAACRALVDGGTICPGRFDAEQGPPATVNLIADDVEWLMGLQQHFANLLSCPAPVTAAHSAGLPATAEEHFTDLRIAATLITVALYDSFPDRVEILDATLRGQRLHTEMRRHIAQDLHDGGPGARAWAGGTLAGPRSPVPMDAAACASLLGLASELLACGDAEDAGDMVKLLFGGSVPDKRIMSLYNWTTAGVPLSGGMRHVLEAARRRPSRIIDNVNGPNSRLRRFVPDLPDAPGLDADNIPQYLPRDWWSAHFTPCPWLSERWQRRVASAILAAALQRTDVEDAARSLGLQLPPPNAMDGIDARGYRRSVASLARELHSRSPHPDYARRRKFMRTWALNDGDWRKLTSELLVKFGQHADTGDRKRSVSCLYIWTRVTVGDHLLAPGLGSLKGQGLAYMWQLMKVPPPTSHYPELVRRLAAHADALAARIDRTTDQ